MSSIFGIINKSGKPVDIEQFKQIKESLSSQKHDGYHEIIQDNAAFGLYNLITYPNQKQEAGPYADGDLLITANAYLHNREELKKKLGIGQKNPADVPHSYIILKAFQRFQENCVHQLDGEYVYSIWNRETQQLFISNDHIGYKTIYYYDSADQFIFCSEIRGIEAVKTSPNYFDKEVLIEFFMRGGDPESTYNREIKSLPGGCVLNLINGKVSVKKYWLLEAQNKYAFKHDTQWYECLRELVIESIAERYSPIVKTGISLSGGLDSSAIACILSGILKKKNQPLYAYSSVLSNNYVGEKQDEKHFIKIVVDHCDNIIQKDVSADNLGPLDNITNSFKIDEYFPNKFHFMNHAIVEAASHDNVGVLFFGLGGDQWVSYGGNTLIAQLFKEGRWGKMIEIMKGLSRVEQKSWLQLIKRELFVPSSLGRRYYQYKVPWVNESFLSFKYSTRGRYTTSDDNAKNMRWHINKGKTFRTLQMLDVRSSNYGLISANPFYDKSILEYMADVPADLFIKNGVRRNLFRRAFDGILPKEIQSRKAKSAFVVDFTERMPEHQIQLQNLVSTDEYEFVFEKYFSLARAMELLNDEEIGNKTEDYQKSYLNASSFLTIAAEVLAYLKKKKYIFE